MIKKRLIFTLLYESGFFVQSRNFNLQKVGNSKWINDNYNFRNISFYIDELCILDISRKKREISNFMRSVREVSESCFVPITVGGGIKTINDARYILSNGSDKVLLNSEIHKNKKIVNEISKVYGEQSIIVSVDLKILNNNYHIFINNGTEQVKISLKEYLKDLSDLNFGELHLNSIDRDGTGNGLDLDILKNIPEDFSKPIILSGGCGNANHIKFGLEDNNIQAVSTANLLNFVGDGLIKAREKLMIDQIKFPKWDIDKLKKLENSFLSK